MLNRIKGFLYDIVLLLACIGGRKKRQKKLLICRTDEIGDYLLWRNFLIEITTHYKAQHYQIHFLGNSSWKSIFDLLDFHQIDHQIWVNKTSFKKSLFYRFKLLRQVYTASYDTVINPIFSRDKRNDDAFVKVAKANTRIGMKANTESVKPYEIGYDKGLYNQLFDYPKKPVFEFYRNKAFTEFITGKSSSITNTKIATNLLPAYSESLPNNYIVVFPGSRSAKRIWPIENFIEVCNYLYAEYQYTVVLCGSVGDKIYTDIFAQAYKNPLVDLTCKTTLPELLTIFSKAKMLLSVDTGSVHLAAAVNCTVVGIYNGSQYKRFAPYPSELNQRFIAVYPDEVELELNNEELASKKYEFVVDIAYSDVNPTKVINLIKQFLLS